MFLDKYKIIGAFYRRQQLIVAQYCIPTDDDY